MQIALMLRVMDAKNILKFLDGNFLVKGLSESITSNFITQDSVVNKYTAWNLLRQQTTMGYPKAQLQRLVYLKGACLSQINKQPPHARKQVSWNRL